MKLYMVMVGCTPLGRFTEQHDIFFGIGNTLQELVPQMIAFWPEAKGKIHIDAWREVTVVGDYQVFVVEKREHSMQPEKLFFMNLGGYKQNEFEEYHYKVLAVAENLADATKQAEITSFYKHYGFKGAPSHLDDKYGIDVDDVHNIKEILSANLTNNYTIQIVQRDLFQSEDLLHVGYVEIDKIMD